MEKLQKLLNNHFNIDDDYEYLHIVHSGEVVEYVTRDDSDFTKLIAEVIDFLATMNHQFKLSFKGRRGFSLTRVH